MLTQSPLHVGDEQLTKEKMEQLGSQGGFFITIAKLEEGNPQESPMPSLELIVVDCRRRELDLVVEQASNEFLSDENFVKLRYFYQFAWRKNIEQFEERCNKRKEKHPKMEEASIQRSNKG